MSGIENSNMKYTVKGSAGFFSQMDHLRNFSSPLSAAVEDIAQLGALKGRLVCAGKVLENGVEELIKGTGHLFRTVKKLCSFGEAFFQSLLDGEGPSHVGKKSWHKAVKVFDSASGLILRGANLVKDSLLIAAGVIEPKMGIKGKVKDDPADGQQVTS